MKCRLTLMLILLPALALPAQAGILFGKKPPKPDPTQRVPELIKTARTDGDEDKRAEAVAELRQYDPTAFPEIMPTVIDVLLNDKKPGVRTESAQTIGKLRPVSQAAGDALEQALDKDGSMRVRLQVRSVLLGYRWAGYRAGKKDEAPNATKEPPLADPKPVNPSPPPRVMPVPTPVKPMPAPAPSTLTPRPLPPQPTPVPSPLPSVTTVPQPLPQGSNREPPAQPPQEVSGPELGGPP